MSKEEILEQLDSIIDNAETMLKDAYADNIWKKDIAVCLLCQRLVQDFVDDNGNIIYDKKTFDTEAEAKVFKEKCGDKYRSMMHVVFGDKEWWTVDYKL